MMKKGTDESKTSRMMSKNYKAAPSIIRDGVKDWSSNPGKPYPTKLTAKERSIHRKHKKLYPVIGIMDYSNEADNPVKFFTPTNGKKGTLVFNVNEKKRQRIFPGKDAKKNTIIHHPPCESMINLSIFHHYAKNQTFCLIAKVLFEMFFKKTIWDDISNQIPEPQSEYYLSCLESTELTEYMQVKKNRDTVVNHIKDAFRKYEIKTATVMTSSDPELVTYYRSLFPRNGSAADILRTFDQIVDSLVWFGDIINDEPAESSLQIRVTASNTGNHSLPRARIHENRSYIPVLQELTYENKFDQVLDILHNDLGGIRNSPGAEEFRKDTILISSDYKEVSRLKEINKIKDKSYLKEFRQIRARLLDLIMRLGHSDILEQLERNSRSCNVSNLNREMIGRIVDLKDKFVRHDLARLSCIIFDVDDYTLITYKYPPHIAPRVLLKIESRINNFLDDNLIGKVPDEKYSIYDRIGRDTFVILVNLALSPALKLAKELGRSIEEIDWDAVARGLRVTCSGGVDEWHAGSEEFKDCIVRASAGLDKAKITRKNNVVRGLETKKGTNRLHCLKKSVLNFLITLKLLASLVVFCSSTGGNTCYPL